MVILPKYDHDTWSYFRIVVFIFSQTVYVKKKKQNFGNYLLSQTLFSKNPSLISFLTLLLRVHYNRHFLFITTSTEGKQKVLVVVKTRTGNHHDSFQSNLRNTSLSSPVSHPPRIVGEPSELHHRIKIPKRTGPTRESRLFQGPTSRHRVH